MDTPASVRDSRRKLLTALCAFATAGLAGHTLLGVSATLPEGGAERPLLRRVRLQNNCLFGERPRG